MQWYQYFIVEKKFFFLQLKKKIVKSTLLPTYGHKCKTFSVGMNINYYSERIFV